MNDKILIQQLGAMRMHLTPVLSREYADVLRRVEERIRGLEPAPLIPEKKANNAKQRIAKYYLK